MKFSMRLVLVTVFTLILFFIVYLKVKGNNSVKTKTVTELISVEVGYPYPYALNHVSQYRFVEQVGEFLVRRDGYQNVIGGLSDKWLISKDRHSIVFHLRNGALYNATEVAQSLKRLLRANQTSHSNIAEQIANESDIKVIDESNLEIKTIGDAGAVLSPLVMADTIILPDDHWITLPGYGEPQVDWTKTRGPYIHVSGNFQNFAKEPILFKPNPKHYIYNPEQLNWKLVYRAEEWLLNFSSLKKLMDRESSYTTIKYSEMMKFSWTENPGLLFYETKPNGTNFLIPNKKKKRFATVESRVAFLKHLFKAKIPILNPTQRANQIPEPGFTGRMLEAETKEVLDKIMSAPDIQTNEPVKWAVPNDFVANGEWVKDVAKAIDLPHEFVEGPYYKLTKLWQDGDHDVLVALIGLSDSDPISGASFLFAPNTVNLDFPDGRILALLNTAKDTVDREVIIKTVHKAFRMALEGGLIFPLNYVTNRYYHTPDVVLSIKDPYTESIMIWDVRLKE